MSKAPAKIRLKLDLLRPQSTPEKKVVHFIRWLLSTGRFIIVFVEALVLIVFITRFKFDADLEATKESIEEQIPFIESQRNDENLIRQTQLQLLIIKNSKNNSPDYSIVLKKIADQTPRGVKISSLNLEKNGDKVNFKISGTAENNIDLNSFYTGLKQDSKLQEIDLAAIGFEQKLINFTLTGSVSIKLGKQ